MRPGDRVRHKSKFRWDWQRGEQIVVCRVVAAENPFTGKVVKFDSDLLPFEFKMGELELVGKDQK